MDAVAIEPKTRRFAGDGIELAVDEAGPTTRALAGDLVVSGAVALLLSASPTDAFARVGELHVQRGVPVTGTLAAGHRALLPLVDGAFVGDLAAASTPDALATVRLGPV